MSNLAAKTDIFAEAAKKLEEYLNTNVFLMIVERPCDSFKQEIISDIVETAIFDFFNKILWPKHQINIDLLTRIISSTIIKETDTWRLLRLRATRVIFSKGDIKQSYDVIVYYVEGTFKNPAENERYFYTAINNIAVRKTQSNIVEDDRYATLL